MNAPTSAAAARKPLPVKSELEAEIGNLLDPEGQKLPAQIEDDGERIRSLVARLTSNSIDELGDLGSDLTSAVRELQEFLKSEGERVQREIVNYAHLTETTLAAIKNIIETTFRPTARATRPRVDWSPRFGRVQAIIRYDFCWSGREAAPEGPLARSSIVSTTTLPR
jgi:gas vesicle protein